MSKIASVYLNQHHVQGKSSCFYVRGRLVPLQKITRYLRRKDLEMHPSGDEALVPLPPHIVCVTVHNSRPSSIIDVPDMAWGDSLLSPPADNHSDGGEDLAVVHPDVDAGASSQSLLYVANNQNKSEKNSTVTFPPMDTEHPSLSRFGSDQGDSVNDWDILGSEMIPSLASLLPFVNSAPHSTSSLHPSPLVSQQSLIAITSNVEASRSSPPATGIERVESGRIQGTMTPRERPACTRITPPWLIGRPIFRIGIMATSIETQFAMTHPITESADLMLAPWFGDLDHLLTDDDGPFCHDINSGTMADLVGEYHDSGWNESQCPSQAVRNVLRVSCPMVIAIEIPPQSFDRLAPCREWLEQRDNRLYFHHFVTIVSRTLGGLGDQENPFSMFLPRSKLHAYFNRRHLCDRQLINPL